MVAVEILEHCVVPRQRLFARKMALDNRAAATLDELALGFRDLAPGNIGERDRRPDVLTAGLKGVNLFQTRGNTRRQPIEHRLHVANLRPQILFNPADGRFGVGGQSFTGMGNSHNDLSSFIRK